MFFSVLKNKLITLYEDKSILKAYLYIISFILVFFIRPQILYDSDYMWHIKVGEYIFKTGIVPTTNIFGYLSELKFFAHEWLFDLILYTFYFFLNDKGVLIFVFLNVCIWGYLIEKIIYFKTKNHPFSVFIATINLLLMYDFIVPRPHISSFCLILLLFYILITNFNNLNKKIFHLILIAVLMVNIHAGSYPIIFVILGMYIFGMFVDQMLSYDKTLSCTGCLTISRQVFFLYSKYFKDAFLLVKKPIFITLSLLFFIVLNPYNFEIYLYPFQVMKDTSLIQNIAEWVPPSFTGLHMYLLIYTLFIFSIFSFNKDRKFIDWFFILIFLILFTKHVRHLSLFIFILTIFSCTYLFEVFSYLKSYLVNLCSKTNLDFSRYYIIFHIIILVYICILSIIFASVYKEREKLSSEFYPSEMLEYIQQNEDRLDFKNNILLNDYNWGGYLIRNDIKVFIDGRADVYTEAVNKKANVYGDYVDALSHVDSWESFLKKYNIKYILLGRTNIFNTIAPYSDKLKILKKTDKAIFLEYLG